jgi:hypothetical protein
VHIKNVLLSPSHGTYESSVASALFDSERSTHQTAFLTRKFPLVAWLVWHVLIVSTFEIFSILIWINVLLDKTDAHARE